MPPVNILLVEDEKTTLRLVGDMLKDLGHQVELFETAELGLEAFEKSMFDVVLSDVELPGIDGIEMVRHICAADPTITPIIMTSRRDQETAVRALESGVRSFLPKPFTPDQLKAKLEEALEERERVVETRLLVGDLIQTRSDLQQKVQEQDHRLTRTERYLHHLLDATPFAILSTDIMGKVLTFNGKAREMYGRADNEAIGQDVSTLFGNEGEVSTQMKSKHLHKSGESFPVLVRSQDILDDTNQYIAQLYIVEDLSEREKLEDQLFYAERISLLGQMAPRIAHELKTPLQLISGYTELALLELQKGETEQARSFVELIDPGVEQILGLVQQISNLAKPEESRREELDLVEELEKILDTLKHLGVVKHSKVVRDFIHPLPRIQGDPGQIEQVFRNLIVNSAQAMEASREKVLGVSLRPSPDGGHLQAVVSDTGPGIPPEHLERIFQPFFTTKEEGKGTGLGLPIVKSILDRHDASIRIESKVGAGTHFYLSFPVAD